MPSLKKSNHAIIFLTDDEHLSRPVVNFLNQEGYMVSLQCKSLKENTDISLFQNIGLIVVDTQKISLEELSLYPRIKSIYTGLLMMLVNSIDEMHQILLYEQGVDDLLIKPINHLLILARIRALFRRINNRSMSINLIFNGLEINGGLRRVSYHGQEISFTAREFDLLWYLARNACITLDRDHLYKAVFGIEYNGYDRSIDMYIARIRSKIASYPDLPQIIKTVRGSGYLFAA